VERDFPFQGDMNIKGVTFILVQAVSLEEERTLDYQMTSLQWNQLSSFAQRNA
jgi:hypothetical protein